MNERLFPRKGCLILDSREGRTETTVEVLEETRRSYRIKALIGMCLGNPGRWLDKGETVLVPKRAIVLLPQPGDVIEEENDATTDTET